MEQEPNWQAAPTETPETISGWGDNDIPTVTSEQPFESAPPDADTNDTANQVPEAATAGQETATEKKIPIKYKGFEDYLKEQEDKKSELEKLLAQMSISAPVPRKIVESDETGGRYVDVKRNLDPKEKQQQKKPRAPTKPPAPAQPPIQVQTKPLVTVESFFTFAADPRETRRRFNQDSEMESSDGKPKTSFNKKNAPASTDVNTTTEDTSNTNNNEPQQLQQSDSNRKGGRRGGRAGGNGGGRGGQGRGGAGRGRRFNSSGRAFNRSQGNAPPTLPTQPEDWPELV